MGEVEEVPGLTEDEMRDLAIRATFEALDGIEQLLPLQPGEFTLEQWRRGYAEEYGVAISDTTARRKLGRLADRGLVEAKVRKADGSGVRVMGYRHVKGEES